MAAYRWTFSTHRHAFKAVVFYISCVAAVNVAFWRLFYSADDFTPVQYSYMHGCSQMLTWGILVPAGGLIATFFRDRPWWLQVHMNLQSGILLLQIPVLYAAAQGGNRATGGWEFLTHPHEVFGYCIEGLGAIQALCGMLLTGAPKLPFTRIRLSRWCHFPYQWRHLMRVVHRILGKLLILAGIAQLGLGTSNLFKYKIGALPRITTEEVAMLVYASIPVGLLALSLIMLSWPANARRRHKYLEVLCGRLSELGRVHTPLAPMSHRTLRRLLIPRPPERTPTATTTDEGRGRKSCTDEAQPSTWKMRHCIMVTKLERMVMI